MMNKIASPQELQHELRRLIAYTEGGRPSRVRIASELQTLSEGLGLVKEAGAFDSENKAQLSALKKHLKSALDAATKAEVLVKELENAAKAKGGDRDLERQWAKHRRHVQDTVLHFGFMIERDLRLI
jgi:hypothetical protein